MQLFRKIKKWMPFDLLDRYGEKFYSQEGEDMILRRFFDAEKQGGYYVDVGAHHPKRFSNTYYFYKRGWKGINIEPRPGSQKAFRKIRPRDITLEVGVSLKVDTLKYYSYKESAFNTFSTERAAYVQDQLGYTLLNTFEVKTLPLSTIFKEHVPSFQKIALLSIDVEGHELEVLKSNNWSGYTPAVIFVEIKNTSLREIPNHDITKYLVGFGYEPHAKTTSSVMFVNHRLTKP